MIKQTLTEQKRPVPRTGLIVNSDIIL